MQDLACSGLKQLAGVSQAMGAMIRNISALMLGLWLGTPVLGAETADIELREGYVDPKSGVKVEKIYVSPDQEFQEITLSVPSKAGPIETVVVTAPRLREKTVPQKKAYTFVKDFDHGRHGLILYLDKDQNVPLRIYMDSNQYQPGRD